MSNIIINKKHINSRSGNNKLRYEFPSTVEFKEGDQLATAHINLFYSWFNISLKHNNNFFQYKWWDAQGHLTLIVDVLIPDGYYSTESFYEWFRGFMANKGHVLETIEDGNYIFFIELLTNETYYANDFRLASLSQQMDFGSGMALYSDYCKTVTDWIPPDTFEVPQIIIPSNNKFGELFGYNPQTIIPNAEISQVKNAFYSNLNDKSPEIVPSSTFILTCNLVDNSLSFDNNMLTAFTLPNGVGFGDSINIDNALLWSNITPGKYNYIDITIIDQNYELLQIIDPNILIQLTIIKHE